MSLCAYVILLPTGANGKILFGTNAHSPSDQINEVVYYATRDHEAGSDLQCTHIEVDQVARTKAVILNKPSWMWGASMGANEAGVAITTINVATKLQKDTKEASALLGEDFVRIALERSECSRAAVDIITSLIAKHGIGGRHAEDSTVDGWTRDCSFLITDAAECWVLETAGSGEYWAAEKVTSGIRCIGSELTITSNIDLMSPQLIENAKTAQIFEGGEFNYSEVFSSNGKERSELSPLQKLTDRGIVGVADMFAVLRDEQLCLPGSFQCAGSQVSILCPAATPFLSSHWFTATPDPRRGLFKPFVFCPGASIGSCTFSQRSEEEGAGCTTNTHELFRANENLKKLLDSDNPKGHMVLQTLQEFESKCIEDMDEIVGNFDEKSSSRVAQIFSHMTNIEINFCK